MKFFEKWNKIFDYWSKISKKLFDVIFGHFDTSLYWKLQTNFIGCCCIRFTDCSISIEIQFGGLDFDWKSIWKFGFWIWNVNLVLPFQLKNVFFQEERKKCNCCFVSLSIFSDDLGRMVRGKRGKERVIGWQMGRGREECAPVKYSGPHYSRNGPHVACGLPVIDWMVKKVNAKFCLLLKTTECITF